jgi:L-lactate dehydrogenase complex protein LldG
MDARDEILDRLSKQTRAADLPAPWQTRRHFDDLAGRFIQTLNASKGEGHRAGNLEEALVVAGNLLRENNTQKIIADGHPLLHDADLPGRWPTIEWFIAGQSEGDLRAFAAGADVGISVATAALAETGTIVIGAGPEASRLTGLLPPVHIVLAPASHLSTDIFTWTALRPEALPSSVTLISGPSKTADIEQTMAVGVHGPGRFIVILYDE